MTDAIVEAPHKTDIAVDLLSLLAYQRDHDERCHREMLWLQPDVRAKHYVLHFSKYIGHLVTVRRWYTDVEWNKTLADIMIIALSAANTWPISPQVIAEDRIETAIRQMVESYLRQRKALSLAFIPWMQEELALANGKMANVCQWLDHGKTDGYRQTIEEGIFEIIVLVLAVARMLNIDLVHVLRMRWQEIEQRSSAL